MRIPKGPDHKPGLHLAIGIFIVAALALTAVGKCSRAAQSRSPSTSQYSVMPAAPVVSGEDGRRALAVALESVERIERDLPRAR